MCVVKPAHFCSLVPARASWYRGDPDRARTYDLRETEGLYLCKAPLPRAFPQSLNAVHSASLSPYDLAKVVHLLLAVAGASDHPPEAHERQRAIELARGWSPDLDTGSVEAIVDTAYVAGRGGIHLEVVACDVARVIGPEGTLRLLSNLGRIAQADGHLELREAMVIARIRAVLHGFDEPGPESAVKRPGSYGKRFRWAAAKGR